MTAHFLDFRESFPKYFKPIDPKFAFLEHYEGRMLEKI